MSIDFTKPFPQVILEADVVVGHLYKFDDLDQLQAAMSKLVAIANGHSGKVSWTFLSAGFIPTDALPQTGYVGVRLVELKPENIAGRIAFLDASGESVATEYWQDFDTLHIERGYASWTRAGIKKPACLGGVREIKIMVRG